MRKDIPWRNVRVKGLSIIFNAVSKDNSYFPKFYWLSQHFHIIFSMQRCILYVILPFRQNHWTKSTLSIIQRRRIYIYTQILSHYENIKSRIQDVEQQLKALPPGTLICTRNGKHYKWYQSTEHTYTYIPKNNTILAQQLAFKKYLNSLLVDLHQEQQAIEQYLKKHSTTSQVETLLNRPAYQTLLTPYFVPHSPDLLEWMNTPYEHNPKHPEHLIHQSNSGHLLRSKSEAIIDMLLYMHKIPFRYECALHLGDYTLFPDFTIRHPQTGDFYYWEHFGLMDNSGYAQNTYSKLQLYTAHGIVPSIQLITTFETKEHPINIDTISKIIEHYFL